MSMYNVQRHLAQVRRVRRKVVQDAENEVKRAHKEQQQQQQKRAPLHQLNVAANKKPAKQLPEKQQTQIQQQTQPIANQARSTKQQEPTEEKKQQEQQQQRPCLQRLPYLPEDVADVDNLRREHFIMESAYVKEIFVYLSEQELRYAISPDFMQRQAHINARMRAVLVEWLQQLSQKMELELDTFYLCVRLLDAFLEADSTTSKSQLQLLGATTLWLASKFEEIYCIDINDLVYYCNNTYSKRQFIKMEMRVLRTLEFNLVQPVCITFLRRLSKVAGASNRVHHVAKYLLELSSLNSDLSCCLPSELASSALLIGLKCEGESWCKELAFYSGYDYQQLLPTAAKLARVCADAPDSKLQFAYKKYLTSANLSVANCCQLMPKSQLITQLLKFA